MGTVISYEEFKECRHQWRIKRYYDSFYGAMNVLGINLPNSITNYSLTDLTEYDMLNLEVDKHE